MRSCAIVLAAGKGLRFKSKPPKLFAKIFRYPVIFYSLDTLCRHPLIKSIVVAANPDNLAPIKNIVKKHRFTKVKDIVIGGRLRQDSVANALKATDIYADVVLIHDAARPFIDKGIVSSVIKQAHKYGAAIAGVPVKATVKRVRSQEPGVRSKRGIIVEETLNRDELWEIQTPQAFRRELILKAYARCGKIPVTDDAALVEKLGRKVRIVSGSYDNIKVTTPEDLVIARGLYAKSRHRL